jgi:3-methylfumaryl-CoA hydratase
MQGGDTIMDFREWIGRTETVSDLVTPTPYAALSATFDRAAERPAPGTPLPALWHWLYFLPLHRQSEIGPDGHAKRGGFLPPIPLPRRMWAGSQFQFHEPVRVGDAVTRISTIQDVTEKSGRTGPLVFVKVRHEISREGSSNVAITEFHDIVYREAAKPGDVAPPPQAAPETSAWEKVWVPDDVLLFRYSALTFNGHRIHYDQEYARNVEGYPDLAVHGPLIATLLLRAAAREGRGRRIEHFAFRGLSPSFVGRPLSLATAPVGEKVEAKALSDGRVSMAAQGRFAS